MRFSAKIGVVVLMVAGSVAAAGGDKKPSSGKMVDSGSFGVYVHGKRVATETFQIEQFPGMSVTKSEFKADGGQAVQTAEMVLGPNGDLRRYTWNETSPAKAETVIEPKEQFLVQRITMSPTEKTIEQPYILPTSTVILDDYFFSQREVLVWRYLGSNCRPDPGAPGCKLPRAQFGALIPRQRTSMLVNMEYVGKETVTIHGQPEQLSRFNLVGDGMNWALWLDSQYKLVRVYVAADATEVVRD
jgi:hypothetical protein